MMQAARLQPWVRALLELQAQLLQATMAPTATLPPALALAAVGLALVLALAATLVLAMAATLALLPALALAAALAQVPVQPPTSLMPTLRRVRHLRCFLSYTPGRS